MRVYNEVTIEISSFIFITVGRKQKTSHKTMGSCSGKFQTGVLECASWNLYRDTGNLD
jgi:hypothetical protein